MSMTDDELLADLANSGDISSCEECRVPIQASVTGHRSITDDQGNEREYCSDCYFSYEPLRDAIKAFFANPAYSNPVEKSELFAGYL
jgi:hypothetical protein